MINLDCITLKAFFDENTDFFIGARLQKIQQPTRADFLFTLRNLGESRKFYININPQLYHLAFISKQNEERRNINIPKQPPMFCMLLRKYLEGCKISDACVVENERILELHFNITDELSQKRTLCLCIELMGKHSNIILYDKISKIIIGCAHNVGSEKSRYRELQGGLSYIYPPKINTKFSGTPLYKTMNTYTTINECLDEYFTNIQEKIIINNAKNKLIEITNSKLKKIKNSIEKINILLTKRDKTEDYRLFGELLTANAYLKNNYSKTIKVLNYYTNENIIIELDETKTLNENAQRYYKLYTKSKKTKEKSDEMLKKLFIEKEYLETILYSINKSSNINDLEDIKTELGINNAKPKESSKLNILKLNIFGNDVYVGKNNKQNDYIISKLSKDEDYWFHTKLCAGSHVLLKAKDVEPDEKTLFECCKLAKLYSSAYQSSKVGVIYTKRKYIKKPPASPLGYVIYKNEKEILID